MTIFAVPSEMRDGLRCTRLTRDLAVALALGDLVVDDAWVRGVLEGASGSQGAGESLRDERYRIKGVMSAQEVVPLGKDAPRDPSTGRSGLLAGLQVTVQGHDPQAVFTQDDVAFLLYCCGADVLGVVRALPKHDDETTLSVSLEESLDMDSIRKWGATPGGGATPSQRRRLVLNLGGEREDEESQAESGGDLTWLMNTLILQDTTHNYT